MFDTVLFLTAQRLDFPSGLEEEDILDWTGLTPNKRQMGYMVIMSKQNSTHNGQVFRLEVQGARNQVIKL